jgi:ankyrin repeat protein
MSDSQRDASAPTLEFVRKQAKRFLRHGLAGDPRVLRFLREHLPGLAGLADAAIVARLKLADVHQALARSLGHPSWAAFRKNLEVRLPIETRALAFLAAVRAEDGRVAGRLLAQDAEVGRHSLHAACAVGDLEAAADWIRRDPSQVTASLGEPRWTPLTYASQSRLHTTNPERAAGILACARLVLDHGADPNDHTPVPGSNDAAERLSVLYRACMSDHVAVVRLLLERGADPNDSESIYHSAQLNLRDCLAALLEHGGDLSGRDPHWGNTPLYFLSGYREWQSGAEKATAGMHWLLEHGADPNVTSGPHDETPLHRFAALGRGAEAVAMLLDHGAHPAPVRGDGRTPYVLAVRAGNVAAVEVLRARGGATGRLTPTDELLGACRRGDAAAARAIAERHPLDPATFTHEDHLALMQAAEDGNADAARLLIEAGFSLASEAPWGGTPLHHAAWHGRPDTVRLLIELGAPLDQRDRQHGSSPMGWAGHGSANAREADDDYLAIVDLLADAGARPEAAFNRWGEAPSQLARPRVAKRLMERGFGPKRGTEG